MKKFFIQTFGCQMNVYDGWRIAAMLERHGFVRTDTIPDADIIILNTCAVRAKATDKVFSALGYNSGKSYNFGARAHYYKKL